MLSVLPGRRRGPQPRPAQTRTIPPSTGFPAPQMQTLRGPAFSNAWPAVSWLWTEGPRPSVELTEGHSAGDLQGNRGDRKWGGGKHSARKPGAPHSPIHLHSLQSQPHTLTQCPELPTATTSHDRPGPRTRGFAGLPCKVLLLPFLGAILVSLHYYNN